MGACIYLNAKPRPKLYATACVYALSERSSEVIDTPLAEPALTILTIWGTLTARRVLAHSA